LGKVKAYVGWLYWVYFGGCNKLDFKLLTHTNSARKQSN